MKVYTNRQLVGIRTRIEAGKYCLRISMRSLNRLERYWAIIRKNPNADPKCLAWYYSIWVVEPNQYQCAVIEPIGHPVIFETGFKTLRDATNDAHARLETEESEA